MFRTAPVAEPAPAVRTPEADPVPLSHLELDLATPPLGWLIELDRRGVEVVVDDLGRKAISRDDARLLITEQLEAEARQREKRAAAERQAVEADEKRRASIWAGIPADHLPVGVAPAAVMLQSVQDARPRRRSVLEEALSNSEGLTYHPIIPAEDEAS